MYQRVKRKPKAEINVVPYIDVMLVLLIIFMVTAPLITQGVKVDLPQASSEPMDTQSKLPVIATVDGKGQYYLQLGAQKSELIDAQEISSSVKAYLNLNQGAPVAVRADKGVDYQKVVELLVLLQQAGVPNVGLMTELPDTP